VLDLDLTILKAIEDHPGVCPDDRATLEHHRQRGDALPLGIAGPLGGGLYICPREGLFAFLARLVNKFEIRYCSMGSAAYVQRVLEVLQVCLVVITRDGCPGPRGCSTMSFDARTYITAHGHLAGRQDRALGRTSRVFSLILVSHHRVPQISGDRCNLVN
jgi:hypothetical protein